MIRLAHAILGFSPQIGGAENQARLLVRNLSKEGIDVAIFTRKYGNDDITIDDSKMPVFRFWKTSGFATKELSAFAISIALLHYFPARLLDRPKKGFSLPINKWLKNDLSFLLDKYLNKKFIEDQGIFNSSYIYDIKVSYLGGKESLFGKVWALLVFQMWHERWIKS